MHCLFHIEESIIIFVNGPLPEIGIYAYLMFLSLTHCDRPENYKELFNLRHAQAHNVIECIFGVMKKQFKVLHDGCEYPIETQAQLVPALAALHNFIRIYDPDDNIEGIQDDNIGQYHENGNVYGGGVSNAET